MIAVTFFDILPESLELGTTTNTATRTIFTIVVISFLFYHFLERFFLTHHHHEEDGKNHKHLFGPIGAGSLIIHSFLDGASISIAYQANAALGLLVALAVITHDFTDGINTVILMLKNKYPLRTARIFLILDALAPLIGILITSLFTIPTRALTIILPIFAGEFLYIAAANVLPETHNHKPWKMALPMLLAVILIFTLTHFI